MLAALLEQPVLDADVQRRLLARAGGNPLYAEQYAEMHVEGGIPDELPMPESVQGIIAARLDLLPLAEKQLLQDAAVLGKVFWLGGLANGRSRAEAGQYLHALERKGFVQRAQRSSVADEPEHSFSHVLVRDAAYAQIPRAARAEKHRRAAEWLEGLGRPDEHAEMLAHHYTSAFELARAAGAVEGDLPDRARHALERAGDRAVALNAYAAATRYYERALELSPDGTAEHARLLFRTGRTRYLAWQGGEQELEEAASGLLRAGDRETAAEAETTLFEVLTRKGQRDAGEAHLTRARELLEGGPPSRAKAMVLMHIALSRMLAGRHEDALEAGRRAFELADLLGLDAFKAATLNIMGVARVGLGDPAGIADIEHAVEIASEANAPYEVARAYNNLTSTHYIFGQIREAREAHANCVRFSERYGQAIWLRWQRPVEAGFAYADGAWHRADAVIEEALPDLEQGSWDYQTGGVLGLRALIKLGRGDLVGALGDAERSVELSRPARDPQALHAMLLDASYVAASAGQRGRATALLDEWIALAGDALEAVSSPSLVHAAWTAVLVERNGELLAALDSDFKSTWVECARAFALGELRLAADLCTQLQAGPEEAYVRLRLADRLAADGLRAEADMELTAALDFYRRAGATYFIREAEALVAATS
jgi:tetratricopeptide (TPR) repeat protein